MEKMDEKGALLNAAFTVSAAFVFADHLAFTLAFDPDALAGMIAGKLIAGVLAIALAAVVYRLHHTKAQEEN
jgi:ethanolamine transporter